MINLAESIVSIVVAKHERELDEQFEEMLTTLPVATAQRMREERKADKERARERADIERRHRELCEAIRSTRPSIFRRY